MASADEGYRQGEERAGESPYAIELPTWLSDGELLERIVEETMFAERGDDDAEIVLLREVAARYRGLAFTLDPVAVEMVRAAVGPGYRKLVGSEQAWQAMTQGIAQTLIDDPRSRQRLEALWRRLQEASA